MIGDGAYTKVPLATAANDGGLIAQSLQAAGFDVAGARDLDGDTLRGFSRFREEGGRIRAGHCGGGLFGRLRNPARRRELFHSGGYDHRARPIFPTASRWTPVRTTDHARPACGRCAKLARVSACFSRSCAAGPS